MDFNTAIAWVKDAVTDLLPLVDGDLAPAEETLVAALKAAFEAYEAE